MPYFVASCATLTRARRQSCRLAAIPGQAGAGAAVPAPTGKLEACAARLPPGLPRKSLRAVSASIQRLVKLVRTDRLQGQQGTSCA